MVEGTCHLTSLFLGTEVMPGKYVIFCAIYTTETVTSWLQKWSLLLSVCLQWNLAAPSIKRIGEYISLPFDYGLALWPTLANR